MSDLDGNNSTSGKAARFSGVILIALLALAGCQNGSTPSDSDETGVAGFAKGVITAKGSIFVNGVEYGTNSSEIMVDGILVDSDSLLEVGMLVELEGTIDPATGKGVAQAIDYASSIEGTVDAASIDTVAGTFEVFGLLIQTNAFTVYKGLPGLAGTSPLADNDRVEVSGMLDVLADGVTKMIRASMVKRENDSLEDFKVRGTVSGLSGTSDGTFSLTLENGAVLTVNFTGTLDAEVVEAAQVKIETSAAPIGGALDALADKIEVKEEHRLRAHDGDRVEASGIVSDYILTGGMAGFTVDGMSISASSALATGVADGVKVEVKGSMEGTILIASRVKVEQDADMEIQGVITAVDAVANTLAVNGVVLKVDVGTIYEDEGDVPVEFFGIDDLLIGDFLEAKTYEDELGDLVAVKIERKQAEAENEMKLKGVVDAKAADDTTITVQGIEIALADLFADSGERADFLAEITVGTTMVELKGMVSGTTITWTEGSIDD